MVSIESFRDGIMSMQEIVSRGSTARPNPPSSPRPRLKINSQGECCGHLSRTLRYIRKTCRHLQDVCIGVQAMNVSNLFQRASSALAAIFLLPIASEHMIHVLSDRHRSKSPGRCVSWPDHAVIETSDTELYTVKHFTLLPLRQDSR